MHALIWSVCSFAFYVFQFYIKYFKGNVFVNVIFAGIGDILAAISVRLF